MDMRNTVEHTKIGLIDMSGVPIHLEKSPGSIRMAAPTLGQHSKEVLKEIGYTNEQLNELAEEGVIKVWRDPPRN